MSRVLVFDSGIGGLSVFDAIVEAGLDLDLDYVADNAWLPYGEKTPAQLRARCPALIAAAADAAQADFVVVACNTASTVALAEIRAALSRPVIGVVPPIKPAAALSRSGVIGLLATPATIRQPYTDDLIARFASRCVVVRLGAAALVAAAEAKLAGRAPDPAAFAEAADALFNAPRGDEIDVVALACTHFPLLRAELAAAAPRAVAWLDSGAAIARRVAELSGCSPGAARARLAIFSDASAAAPVKAAFRARGFTAGAELGEAPRFALRARSVLLDA